LFGTRRDADRLIGTQCLLDKGLTGSNVNVVVVDSGIDQRVFRKNFVGGWTVNRKHPGTEKWNRHGEMIVRNILQAAPDARIFDLPLIPADRILDINAFISLACAAWLQMLVDIKFCHGPEPKPWPGPWIVVNPWAVFDRRLEHPPGWYTNRRFNPFNLLVVLTTLWGIDVIFASGNCGHFSPDMRCGIGDVGPNRDILGANSLEEVISVGAVRSDGVWLGYSSEGYGQPKLAREKPDFCAPSQFSLTDDAAFDCTGTSASAAVVAGVVAAIRSHWGPDVLPPDQLRKTLRDTAGRASWDRRFGYGILDVCKALAAMPAPVTAWTMPPNFLKDAPWSIDVIPQPE
jgi:hypothetical protein